MKAVPQRPAECRRSNTRLSRVGSVVPIVCSTPSQKPSGARTKFGRHDGECLCSLVSTPCARGHNRENMSDHEDLQYPNLSGCKVTLVSTSSGSRPPVQLPIECRSAVHVPIPAPYDFSLGTLLSWDSSLEQRQCNIGVPIILSEYLFYSLAICSKQNDRF